jgi:hypothetical protein
MAVVDASSPDGVWLSQAVDHTTLGGGSTAITLPAVDDGGQVITLAPTCWLTDGDASFYGTPYTDIAVCSNGRILAGSTVDADFSPSVAEAVGDAPMIGNWADLSPNVGGTYTISSPAPDLININYSGVPFFAQAGTSVSFDVDYNDLTGEWTLNNLQGILPSNTAVNQFLGMSPGGGTATDPGGVSFFLGGAPNFGVGVAPTDMRYEFSTGTLQNGSIGLGMNGILFTPDGSGNYTWLSFWRTRPSEGSRGLRPAAPLSGRIARAPAQSLDRSWRSWCTERALAFSSPSSRPAKGRDRDPPWALRNHPS